MKLTARLTADEENSIRDQLRHAWHWLAIGAAACRPRDPTKARLDGAAARVQAAQTVLDTSKDPQWIREVLEAGDYSGSPRKAAKYLESARQTCEVAIARIAERQAASV